MLLPKKVKFIGHTCDIKRRVYPNGTIALELYDEDTGAPVATATVAIKGVAPKNGLVLIKNWSENQGLLEALISQGIVEDTGVTVPTGFVEAHLCKLLV